MEGLDEDAVDFRANYDGTLTEPVVLPAAFPNLLANGSSGIAVGMATNIPPHNIDELVAACLHLIKTPNARDETLVELIPGPDFPTGGVIVEPRDIDRRDLPHRARRVPAAGALGGRGSGPRPVADRRHRNSLPGAEVEADRAAGRTDPDRRKSRSWPMSATKAPRMSASCSNRAPAPSSPKC